MRAGDAVRRVLIAMLAALASACAENAVLEVQVMLPAAPAGVTAPVYGVLEVRRASTHPHDVVWAEGDPDGVELGPERVLIQRSVIGREEDVDLHVKVRFCASPACNAIGDDTAPELRYVLEHPFYIGRRTAWATCIEAVPATTADPDVVDLCEIHGCIEGAGSSNFCDGDQHFCETGAEDVAPRDLLCTGGIAEY